MSEDRFIPFSPSDLTGRRVLVLAPHPDDETIGCGGTLALHRMAKDPVKVVFMTNGGKGDMSGRFEKQSYIALRQAEARIACERLGGMDIEFWPYEDRGLEAAIDVRMRIFELLKSYLPDIVYAPSPHDYHPDHRAACSFLCAALQLYESPCDVAFCEIGQPLRVNRVVDITSVLDRKKSALSAYESQLYEREYDEITIAMNRFRSMTLSRDVTHAEGFSLWPSEQIREAAYLGCSLLVGRCLQDI